MWRALKRPRPCFTAAVVRPLAEQRLGLAAGGLVARHEQHGAAPGAAQGRVDARLADERPVEPEVAPAGAGDGVVHDAVGRAGHRVHADEERRVAALLEELRVLRPLLLDDEVAARIEQIGDQRVERPAPAGAVAVHHDDLARAAGERAPHGGVDLLGVEAGAIGVERLSARRLLPLRDAGDALHVAHDEDAHAAEATSGAGPPQERAGALYAARRPTQTKTGATMPRLITSPTSIPVPGGKIIDEYVGAVNTQTDGVSIAHMRAPADWKEPFQTPEFDEYTLVLKGSLRVEHEGGHTDVTAGQAILTGAGERVRYSTLEECEYVAICLPAFTPDRVQREDE